MKNPIIAAGLLALASGASASELPVLKVYTYDSFVSDWGPGPQIEAAFEAQCDCDLQFVAAGDGAALLARIRLEGSRSDADVVLGLDTNLTAAAADTGLFAPHRLTPDLSLPVTWDDPLFLPYDWGHFAFVYDNSKITNVPTTFQELADSDLKIIIQDPRSSTPGLGLLLWVDAAYGQQAADIWTGLTDNIVTVTKGWSEAYGLFLEGEADMVLSYTTSPAYHRIAEGDMTKSAAIFDEGHYLQIEVAGKLAATDQPELANQFLAFMLSDSFQDVIPTTNWMFPVRATETGLPEGFAEPIQPAQSLAAPASQAAERRDQALATWLGVLSQ